jgi:hypothetical protein
MLQIIVPVSLPQFEILHAWNSVPVMFQPRRPIPTSHRMRRGMLMTRLIRGERLLQTWKRKVTARVIRVSTETARSWLRC